MALRFFLFFLLIVTHFAALAQSSVVKFDISKFYRAFSSENVDSIEDQLSQIDPQGSLRSKAYAGALLMKKAGKVKGAKEKLETFKEGKELLDAAISNNPENAEFRFLRLVIQEQAPAILKYNNKKKEDAEIVITTYNQFPEVVKNYVKNYSQNSETLNPDDFE